ncbi:MAG TPA: RES family NAD+ phosphorylase [Candidatus Elarobacter sp.]|jgi:RES domain-containing protein|nr:RES family NAD+ phosphorylase [Candidatus Elarobacter sp.]
MEVYRIGYRSYAANPLDGEGSFLYGGRWSSPGTRVAYTSTTLTLAMAEFLAHVNVDDLDPETPPPLFYLTARIPDDSIASLEEIGAELPPDWNQIPAPDAGAAIGDAWIRGGASLALLVPSVHVPISTPERNLLLNPRHGHFSRVTWTIDDFVYDKRLVRARASAQTFSRRSR